MVHLNVSHNNRKLGDSIASVSFPVGVTCREDAPCYSKCYARKMQTLYPRVYNAWKNNLDFYKNEPERFFEELLCYFKLNNYFRMFVGGDIPDQKFIDNLMIIAGLAPNCKILLFTKKYELVNNSLSKYNKPNNLVIILSNWRYWTCDNIYNLPTANYYTNENLVPSGAFICKDKCESCILNNCGCFNLKDGDSVYFKLH